MKRFLFLLLAVGACGGAALAQETETPAAEAVPVTEPADAPLTPTDAMPLDTHVVTPVEAPAADVAPVPQPQVQATPAPVIVPSVPPVASTPPPPPLVPAGRWDGDFSTSLTITSGSTSGQSLNLGLDAAYQRPDDKLTLIAQYLESSARSVDNGVVTTNLTARQWRLGGRYDRDLTPYEFGFLGLEFSGDQMRQLALRSETSTGLGRHVVKMRDDRWDVFGGLSYREDYYYPPGVQVDGAQRTRYDTIETLLGEESNHKLTDTARFKQRFVFYPGLGNSKGTRASLDAGLQVDLNRIFSLNVKLQGRYDSLTEAPAEKYDLLFMTGLSVKFGG